MKLESEKKSIFMQMISKEIIDRELKIKTEILSKRIIENMRETPLAIYLVGGYGRGEGAWYEDEEGLHPYNDFDLAVITDTPLSHEKTETLRKELAKEVGIKWVDIDYYSVGKLFSLTPTIHNVDLLEGCSLIYGEDVIKTYNIRIDKKKIGKEDIIKLYRTRMWTFLGSWDGAFRNLNVEESRFFRNQMAKAVLAANDMRLVNLKEYTTSYRERAKIIMNEFKDDASIYELTEWAIKEKLRPSSTEITKNGMERLYFCVKDDFLKAFQTSMGDDADYFLDPTKTQRYYLFHTRIYLSHFYQLLKHRRSVVKRSMDIFYAMNYVFHANQYGKINEGMIKKASNLLMKHGYIHQPDYNWDELRLLTANARNNI